MSATGVPKQGLRRDRFRYRDEHRLHRTGTAARRGSYDTGGLCDGCSIYAHNQPTERHRHSFWMYATPRDPGLHFDRAVRRKIPKLEREDWGVPFVVPRQARYSGGAYDLRAVSARAYRGQQPPAVFSGQSAEPPKGACEGFLASPAAGVSQ